MKQLLPYLLFVVLIFNACTDSKTSVKLSEKSFGEWIEMNDVLTFTFSKNLIPEERIGVYDTLSYIQFDPEIKGHFRWNSPDQLTFVPDHKLPPATSFKGKLTNALVSYQDDISLSGELEFSFHTTELMLTAVNGFWKLDDQQEQMNATLEVHFNHRVDPALARANITIELGGEETAYEISNMEPSKFLQLQLTAIKAGDDDLQGKVTIGQKLQAAHGNMNLDKALVRNFALVSPFRVAISETATSHDGTEGIIEVFTTQKVSSKNIKRFISILPAVEFEVLVENSSFKIVSKDFTMATSYTISVVAGLSGELGGKLADEYMEDVTFQKLRPSLKFTNNEKTYLSGLGERNIELNIVSVEKIKIEIYKLYENNLGNFRNNVGHYYDWEDDCYYYDYRFYDIPNYGDMIFSESVDVSGLERRGNTYLYNLDFKDEVEDYKGIYLIRAQGDQGYRTRDAAMVSMSDIGMIVKEGKHTVQVFTNSIKTAEPMAGVSLRFIGRNNQLLGEATSDANGVAVFKPKDLNFSGFELRAVSAALANDYNFISLNTTSINSSQFDVGGRYDNETGLQVFMYSERNLYRPGETVNLSALIRDGKWKVPEKLPYKIEIITPRGQELKKVRKFTNEQGSFEYSFKLATSALTGRYTARVLTTSDVVLNSYSFSVEEFMPDRIKVKAELNQADFKVKDTVIVDVLAENFFGPPAANRNYEVQYSIYPQSFYAKEYPAYSFYMANSSKFKQLVRTGKTDASGAAQEQFIIPAEYKKQGLLKTDMFVTVFDETGRPVATRKSAKIFTQEIFVGLGSTNYWVDANQMISFPMIAVDRAGAKLTNAQAEITLIKHEYKTVLTKSGSYFRYRSHKIETVVESKAVTLSGNEDHFDFVPKSSGRYEMRLSIPGSSMYVSRHFYAYSWGYTDNNSFKVNSEGKIDFEFDKEKYQPGDVAKVLLKAPFKGKILVTLENNELVDHFYVSTDKRVAAIEIPIKDSYKPNIYLSATLIKPHAQSDIPLTVAHGYAPIFVENPTDKFELDLEHVDKSRSRTKQTIKVKSTPNSLLTLAVVDEGILQISGFKTPDAYEYFFAKRALQVTSYDIYPYLYPEVNFASGLPGGGGMDMAKRVNPLTNNRVKLVRYWSGILETDSKGEVEYTIDIPQFSGKLRVMALAYKDHTFSSAESSITIADPLVLSVALPRFLSPMDTVIMPVVITNTTDEPTKAKVKLYTEGALEIDGINKENIEIPAHSEARVVMGVNAMAQIGAGKVIVSVDAMGETFVNETDITVRPASTLQKVNTSGLINGGSITPVNEDFSSDVFMKSSFEQKLIVSNSPMVEFAKDLDYLVGYPHGCIEQTVSRVFPQLYFDDLISVLYNKTENSEAVRNVNAAIDKLKTMQLHTGGMTYWPGAGYETWWGSVYASHFLLEAKLAGYNVEQKMLDKLYAYMKNKLKQRNYIEYYYNYNKRRSIASKEIAYSLYVLALAGEPQYSMMNYYKARPGELSLDSRYLLAGSFALSGEMDKFREIMPPSFEGEQSVSAFGGSFYSFMRDEAISLNVLLEVDPDNPQIPLLAKHMSQYLKTRRYMNTQERVFAFLALGKLSRVSAGNTVTAKILCDGQEVGSFDGKTVTINNDELPGTNISIDAKGKGSIYYFWEGEGIRTDGSYKEEDSFIKVRKVFLNRDGSLNTDLVFKQNDLVVVRISVEGSYRSYIENVAITDLLPAGFEIENARISDVPGLDWIRNRRSPQYEDIRDDRISMFDNVYNKKSYYYYFVRAVSPGIYQMGPVNADAMYNSEYHSYHGAGVVRIE